MNIENYKEIRAQLVKEFWFLKSKRLFLSAKARVRKIADLDFEQKGISHEETLKRFNYTRIGFKDKEK